MNRLNTVKKTTKASRAVFFAALMAAAFAAPFPLAAQGFGFDSDAADGAFGGSGAAVSISGEASAEMTGFVNDFARGAGAVQLGDVFLGELNFSAETSSAAAAVNLKLAPGLVYYGEKSPVYVDEAYVRLWFGNFDVEGGLRKLAWGRADGMGPLDVVNPLDYSDLTGLSDMMNMKIARPLVHASLSLGRFSKLEGVFVPNFEPDRFAESGRWEPPQFEKLKQNFLPESITRPDTSTLDYAQAGLRFTTTIGGAADIGAQYYYGRFTTPVVVITPPSLTQPAFAVEFVYSPYHQIGLDYAQVVAGFNLRAEFAANITEDVTGDDAAVKNPSLAWSLGFDRDLFAGVNLNVQCNETIRLLDGEISNPLDVEADVDAVMTRISVQLSKKIMRDKLELKTRALWDVESGAGLIAPAAVWTAADDATVELSGGVFLGGDEGLFGGFHDNSFIKLAVKYTF
ncbi:MAG: hypothetical protein LBC53_09795 [Spirochaetaceae bacterium]|jgi:hypothetical protein|nr:hypothetical protein [Spirochaetaceae bacterium]